MHYVLVGPGALGCLLASTVARALNDRETFTILDYNQERAEHISRNGIVYQQDETTTSFPVNAVSNPLLLGHVDVILLCVKSYDIKSCLEICSPILSDKTLLIFMQNGISHLTCENNLHGAIAAYGTTTEGATIIGTGHLRHAGRGHTYLGFLKSQPEHFQTLLSRTHELLSRGGMQTSITNSILTKLWAKLFVNVGINALTATLNCKNGELTNLPDASRRMQTAIIEAMEIARAKDIDILGDPVESAQTVCKNTASNVSSMLQDVRKKRRTEIDAINGAIVTFGKELSIDTPENALLLKQVKGLENEF